jgi:far upstream element-binding protein
MQNTTGCKINVSQASGADIEREIGLVGTRQAIEDAKKAIWDKVDSVVSIIRPKFRRLSNIFQREKNGGGYGGGNSRRPAGRDNGNSDPYSQPQQPSYGQGQPASQGPPASNPMVPPPQGAAGGEDPYAIWGGYQNYAAYYWAAMAAQQQGQTPGQGEQKRPPPA